jgi:glycosyltransferase involved in cell wall biosynthesis
MDPNRAEVKLVCEEERKWTGWTEQRLMVPEEYFARREQEWAKADRIVVNSDFSRRALRQQGVPESKLVVIPLSYEIDEFAAKPGIKERKQGEPLRVLFLGQVILRKGIQYLFGAARQLMNEKIHFDVVGPVGISRSALDKAPSNITFHGRAGRDQAAGWYRRAHLFVLPTISDGFAITQLEAMASGLPVVATPNCGEVVNDGINGFVIPVSDTDSLALAFRRYLEQPELLPLHSAAALQRARQFSLQKLAANLLELEAVFD